MFGMFWQVKGGFWDILCEVFGDPFGQLFVRFGEVFGQALGRFWEGTNYETKAVKTHNNPFHRSY